MADTSDRLRAGPASAGRGRFGHDVTMVVWTVKGGRQGEREARLLEHGFLGGGWEQLSSLQGVLNREEVAARYSNAYPDVAVKAASNYVGQFARHAA